MNLDPNLRKKLLNESRNPFKGIRRVIWIALSASAGVGLLIMGFRYTLGENVFLNDLGIQLIAFFIFLTLSILDSSSNE